MNASIEIQSGILNTTGQPEIKKYFNNSGQPYANVPEVMSQIPEGRRHQGLTVNVAGVEYWWATSNVTIDPVIKSGGTNSTLAKITESNNLPLWNGGAWPGSGGVAPTADNVDAVLTANPETTPTGDTYIPLIGKAKAKLSAIVTLFANTFAAKTHNHTKSEITDFPTIPTQYTDANVRSSLLTGVTEAGAKANILATDSQLTAWGKFMKLYTSLKALAFKDTVDYSTDVTNKPSIPAIGTGATDAAAGNHTHSGYEPAITKSTGLLSWTGSAWAWVANNFLTSSSLKTVNGNNLVGSGDISITGGGAGSDTAAIHDNESGEIAALTAKTPVDADAILIEDSAASNGKKKVLFSGLRTFLNTYYNLYTHPNHSGDVTSVADGATTIANNVVTNAKLSQVATATIKGRKTTGMGNVEDLTPAEVLALIGAKPDTYKGEYDEVVHKLANQTTNQNITLVKSTINIITDYAAEGVDGSFSLGDTAQRAITLTLPADAAGFEQYIVFLKIGSTNTVSVTHPTGVSILLTGSLILQTGTTYKLIYERFKTGASATQIAFSFSKIS